MDAPGPEPLLPGRAPIGFYGKGGFRTGGRQHRGSLLILPQGTFPWPVVSAAELTPESLSQVLAAGPSQGFLLLGTGAAQIFPDRTLRDAFASAGLALEAMDTPAACRTYNVLLGEGRVFATALIAMPA